MNNETELSAPEGLSITPASSYNRKERRDRFKHFKKMLEDHIKRKPNIKVDQISEELSEEEQAKRVLRVQKWVSRYAVLINKCRELNESRAHS